MRQENVSLQQQIGARAQRVVHWPGQSSGCAAPCCWIDRCVPLRAGTAETRASELSAREQTVRQQEGVEVPRARHTISLYANISSIRWDFK